MITIRTANEKDWTRLWRMIEPVFRAGETYAFSPEISEDEAKQIWLIKPQSTFVAVDENGDILGTYFIKPNQPGLGAHVCNCGYIVSVEARGQGIASQMCIHSQKEAVQLGFRAMQYNFVVATNTGAVRLWQRLGFDIAGTLPGAFHHKHLGFVDAHVMYKTLI